MNKLCTETRELPWICLPPACHYADGLQVTTTTLLSYSSRTTPCWPVPLGTGGTSYSYQPPAFSKEMETEQLNIISWPKCRDDPARAAKDWDKGWGTRPAGKDAEGPGSSFQDAAEGARCILQHLPQPQLPASPGQAPWGPLPQQQWSWGGQRIRGVPSPLAHRNRVLGTIPSLEQTTTPVSMRVAEAKEGVQTQLPHCPWQPWCQTSSCPC